MHQKTHIQSAGNGPASDGSAQMNRKQFLAEAGRSILGLLSLPTVAAISGCGPKKEPLRVDLAALIAAPNKYDGMFITTQGYATPEEPQINTSVYTYYDHTRKMLSSSVSYTAEQFQKLAVSEGSKEPAISTYEFWLFPLLDARFRTPSAASKPGYVTVTGTMTTLSKRAGFVLKVESIRKLEDGK